MRFLDFASESLMQFYTRSLFSLIFGIIYKQRKPYKPRFQAKIPTKNRENLELEPMCSSC